jgi:hypothetical protein
MSAHSSKIARRLVLTGAAISISGTISALTADWAFGAQVTKGDRMMVHQTREIRNYDRPRRNGNRIAFCLTAAVSTCGKHAADAFCHDNDFEGALTFQRERMEGHSAQLRFLRIKCWRSRATTASEVAGVYVKSNTSTKSNRLRLGGQGDWK